MFIVWIICVFFYDYLAALKLFLSSKLAKGSLSSLSYVSSVVYRAIALAATPSLLNTTHSIYWRAVFTSIELAVKGGIY